MDTAFQSPHRCALGPARRSVCCRRDLVCPDALGGEPGPGRVRSDSSSRECGTRGDPMNFDAPYPNRNTRPLASPAPAGEVSRASVTEGVFISPSGCHGLLRRTTRAPSSPLATHYTNTQVTPVPGCHHSPQSGAVVLLKPPKDTTARLRRDWCHPDTTATLPSPRGVAGETSPALAVTFIQRKWQGVIEGED